MKKTERSLFYLVVILMIAITAIVLSSCTETIMEELIVEKYITKDSLVTKTDTVFINQKDTIFIDRVRIDSVAYPVFKNDTIFVPTIVRTVQIDTLIDIDTVYIERIVNTIVYDTIIKTVYVYDSIHVVQHHYADTLFIPVGWSSTYLGEYEATVQEFFNLAPSYGWNVPGGDILIEAWTYDEAPPASRSSYSFKYFDQVIFKIKDTISPDEAYSAVMRELGRWQLGKRYTNEPNDFMNPDFDWRRIKLSSSAAEKKPYLDKLFAK